MFRTRIAAVAAVSGMWVSLMAAFPARAADTLAGGAGSRQTNPQVAVPGVVVVKFAGEQLLAETLTATGRPALDSLLRAQRIQRLQQVLPARQRRQARAARRLDNVYFAHFHGGAAPEQVAAALRQSPLVIYAEPKYRHTIIAIPNDPSFPNQTFYNLVRAPQAWDAVKGEQGSVVIAIVDGGTDIGHPDLAANLWRNPGEIAGNGVDDDHNGFIDDVHGWNFANNTPDPTGLAGTPDNANHGTHTAGLATAVTDNNTGVAGMSWNAKLMAVCASDSATDRYITYGFEGILYAVNNGADIISLSWGGYSNSAFEQEVIDYAADLGVAIVAAAGNNNSRALHYPSAYRHVLAVANTTNSDTRNPASNYGTWVDVAAPGTAILSTVNHGQYATFSGTSMSCPLVAGLVALVRTRHPDWNGLQAAEQVRVTADNIDSKNPGYAGLLGFGRINAQRAVTESLPSLRLTGVRVVESDGDGVIEPGETVDVWITLHNYLAAASGISVSLLESDAYITLTSATARLAALGTQERAELTTPLRFTVAGNAPSGHPVDFTLRLVTNEYEDRDYFTLTILPTAGAININNIATTVTNIGRLGNLDPADAASGVGFRFKNGPSLLFEGGIIAGTGPAQISNAVRGLLSGSQQLNDQDFTIAPNGDLRVLAPGTRSDQESLGIFEDGAANNPMNIRITQESFAMKDAPHDDFILLRYSIENQKDTPLNNFHFGVFFDWDIDGGTFATNKTDHDASRRLGYAFDSGSGPKTYVGMSLVSESPFNYEAIYNDPNAPGFTGIGLHDGFTDTEKWQSISGGIGLERAGPADVSFVVAAGPFDLAPHGVVTVGFALLAGENLADLQANADAAQALWRSLFATQVSEPRTPGLPTAFGLAQNFPNPFQVREARGARTTIAFQLPVAETVTLELYDVLGQKVRTLVHERRAAGFHRVMWDGRSAAGGLVPNGIYFYRLTAGSFIQTRKLVLLR
ncbi:MAG: S8 family serine peptidase [candidate division KSB1 bacterium]|nr:S8 family serine peptidase [candidate division KSB1 bacterium]MDZ7273582.1 S8 family serine peptidase [candidate division KSB1 bacterium]MDZ7286827.1 S8 family serine peptidase [candidate division KSB1 bacterium]MDZ7299816.1 S8 family serine peptidase [candidate division KSB1 bacterium]MDZ7308459.1 S8 family serine peptidase [candidate division KSB1 bacterium]